MTEHEHDRPLGGSGETTRDEPEEAYAGEAGLGGEEDVGLIGGGGPASTTEPEDPKDEPARRPDTEHEEL